MSPHLVALSVFGSLFGAALLGMRVRAWLPEHHLSSEAKDSVRVAMATVATMAALVLGLLVASTKGTYDAERNETTQLAAHIIYLDRLLAMYGPETAAARGELRQATEAMIARMWPADHKGAELEPTEKWSDALPRAVYGMSPKDDVQRALKAQAAKMVDDLGQMRWLLYEQTETSVSGAMLVVVILWLGILFLSIGLFAPPNATVLMALALSAISVSGAIYLILELDLPYGGMISISSEPMRLALSHLGAVTIDLVRLEADYFAPRREVGDPGPQVSFGTSGHRGSSLNGTFTEAHILAITQSICEYRRGHGIDGPLYLGKDTHALSAPAQRTALEVLAANGVDTVIQRDDGVTPTPVISHAIIAHNRRERRHRADGIVITPSHNPPEDGGFKYNATNGGPADTDVTRWIQDRANALLRDGNAGVVRITPAAALKAATTHRHDFVGPYVADLASVLDMDAIAAAGLHLAADALGGAAGPYWDPIASTYGLDITVVNAVADPAFGFMPPDHDGRIRMDCSSPYAMAGLLALKDRYRLAVANDPDADRHGIVTPTAGLLNPNHYLAVAINYLLAHRSGWPGGAAVGKTLVSSSIIDRVVTAAGRQLLEVPVGFKWFSAGLFDGSCCFGGEESAGASFLRRDGTVWTTDKDGIILALLAAEITARTERDPGEHYRDLAAVLGDPDYKRIDAPATAAERAVLGRLAPGGVTASTLAGEPITARLTTAPGNGAPIGGLKVVAENCWFAARPSGTEDIYKIYAESFNGPAHLDQVLHEARDIVNTALTASLR